MTLIEKIPTLTDAELNTLLANARRLDITGTPDQRRAGRRGHHPAGARGFAPSRRGPRALIAPP
jgi:hypothetical protein